jgi:malonyl CoA-acyl carrier protein transacylase
MFISHESSYDRVESFSQELAMLAFVFPGQGAQKRGMGEGLFDEVPEYATIERGVDSLLGYSMRKLCLEDADDRLKDSQYTQPALYTVNALHYYSAVARGERPQFVAGHSLGEYNALLAAGVFDFMTGLRLVRERGRIFSRALDGGMGAVIGLDVNRIAAVLRESGLTTLDIANLNSPTQTVLSGPLRDITRAGPFFERAGAQLYVPLNVSGAFHSRYMADAKSAFGRFIASFTFEKARIPVISNVTGEPYAGDRPTETVQRLLTEQITNSVQWVKSISYLLAAGVSTFKEIGPGTVLTRLIQQIPRQAKAS